MARSRRAENNMPKQRNGRQVNGEQGARNQDIKSRVPKNQDAKGQVSKIRGAKNQDVECCQEIEVHEDVVRSVTADMPEDEILYDLAELYKVFGDSTRIKILWVLFEADMCVCDIAEALSMGQSAISHQLRVLKQAQLVKFRREGKQVIYSLADDHVRTIIDQGMEHIME